MLVSPGCSLVLAALRLVVSDIGREISESAPPRVVIPVPADEALRAAADALADGQQAIRVAIPVDYLRPVVHRATKRAPEPDPRPIERRVAGWWGDIERGEDRPATVEMERRIARALQRGGAHRLGAAECWRRVQVWSAARGRNGRRPSATVLRDMIRDDEIAARWERAS